MKTLLYLKSLWILALLLSAVPMQAQKAEQPNQKYDLGANINEMTLTVGGVLVVATNDGLAGIKPDQSEPIFVFNDFGKLKAEETEFIPNSPYIVVSQGGDSRFAGLTKTKRAVINYLSGQVIFNSENDNWNQIYTCDVVLPENKLIVSGIQKEGDKFEKMTPKVAVYDLASNTLDYSFFLDKPGRVGLSKDFNVTGIPLLLKEFLIIPTAQGLIAKSHTGEDLWETKIKNIGWMVSDETETEIYGFESTGNGKNTRIHKIGKDGIELWEDDRKIKGVITNFEILPNGLAVVSNKGDGSDGGAFSTKSESEIAFLSAVSGEDLWEKAPKTKGYVQHFYIMEDGILFGIQSGGINKISFEGEPLFKKPLKTGENIMIMAHTPNGLIYITSEDANIVNLENGEQVWKKPLKYKSAERVASTFDQANSRYLISANETIYAIDANSSEISEIAEVDFEEKESPTNIQVRDGNLFLNSSQNLMLLEENGQKIYHEYYKSPSKSGFMKIAAGITAAASITMSVAYSAKAQMNKMGYGNSLRNYNEYGKENLRTAEMFSNIAGASFKVLSKRFKASSATENAQFILTKLEDGVGLVKVNKDTGKVDKEIILKDKKPEYQVDEYGGYLYYKANDKTIYAYNLNN
ncbi:PQQ-binding-like beta-propeller repeat protein [Sediminibacter sp. Hel_I_10]|uniref:PQQ-binding-like beta-propeller repeat protein n=1 Tax=Sediminibacter sp. Hel_I_10 TaxID=1392490 RepID=UPI00047AE391|nr:PQQ-binding-like beta-propeller repeat protein [Sediminibacter sp. Hel_I_10]